MAFLPVIDPSKDRFPICVVWTPIPLLTWLFPFIGHMGIAYSNGIIRDFAGPYHVSEDDLAFGRTTRYLELSLDRVSGGQEAWDRAVYEASEEYKGRMHNLCCDNCHSHVSLALNKMQYNDSTSYNMIWLAAWMFFRGKYTGFKGLFTSWFPSIVIYTLIILAGIFIP